MRLLRVVGAGTLVALLIAGPLRGQNGEGALSVTAFAGVQNQPGGFDVFRNVDYDLAKLVGGGLALGLIPNISVRADFAYAMSSGRESGPLNESVDLNRTYFGASLELRVPTSLGVAPYVFGGGGFVKLRRTAPSYNFDLTESGGLFGGGIGYSFRNSPVSAFLQVKEWIYPRTSAGGTQYDTAFSAGLMYKFPW